MSAQSRSGEATESALTDGLEISAQRHLAPPPAATSDLWRREVGKRLQLHCCCKQQTTQKLVHTTSTDPYFFYYFCKQRIRSE